MSWTTILIAQMCGCDRHDPLHALSWPTLACWLKFLHVGGREGKSSLYKAIVQMLLAKHAQCDTRLQHWCVTPHTYFNWRTLHIFSINKQREEGGRSLQLYLCTQRHLHKDGFPLVTTYFSLLFSWHALAWCLTAWVLRLVKHTAALHTLEQNLYLKDLNGSLFI